MCDTLGFKKPYFNSHTARVRFSCRKSPRKTSHEDFVFVRFTFQPVLDALFAGDAIFAQVIEDGADHLSGHLVNRHVGNQFSPVRLNIRALTFTCLLARRSEVVQQTAAHSAAVTKFRQFVLPLPIVVLGLLIFQLTPLPFIRVRWLTCNFSGRISTHKHSFEPFTGQQFSAFSVPGTAHAHPVAALSRSPFFVPCQPHRSRYSPCDRFRPPGTLYRDMSERDTFQILSWYLLSGNSLFSNQRSRSIKTSPPISPSLLSLRFMEMFFKQILNDFFCNAKSHTEIQIDVVHYIIVIFHILH